MPSIPTPKKRLLARIRVAFLLLALLLLHPLFSLERAHEEGRRTVAMFAESIGDLVHIPIAHAQGGRVQGANPFPTGAQTFFTRILEIFVVLNWMALSAVQALLDPDVIFGKINAMGIRPMEAILWPLWIASRNIVNMIFTFILLAAGIYLIVSAGSEGTSRIRQAAPKFVIAVILVNFSWFFPRVIFDASSVLTSVIYQLPSLVNAGMPCVQDPGPDRTLGTADDVQCTFVWKVVLFPTLRKQCTPPVGPPPPECVRPNAPNGKQIGVLADIYYADWSLTVQGGQVTDPVTGAIIPVSGADAIVNGLAVNFAKIPNLGVIDFQKLIGGPQTADGFQRATAYLAYFIRLVLHVIVSLAIGLALLALTAVLIVRLAVLWLCIAFMPFIFIGLAMGRQLGDLTVGKEAAGPNIWEKFLFYTFLPAMVAVPFSVGFMLLSQLYYVKAMSITLDLQNFWFLEGVSDVYELLWLLMAIGIIWMGVFAVLAKEQIAQGITSTVKGIGQTGMKVAGYGLAYGMQLPLPGKKSFTVGGAYDAYKNLPNAIRFKGLDALKGGKGAGGTTPPTNQTVRDNVAKLSPQQITDLSKALRDTEKNLGGGNDARVLEELERMLKKSGLGMSDTEIRGLINNKEALRNLLDSHDSRGNRIVGERERDSILKKIDAHLSGGRTPQAVSLNQSPGSLSAGNVAQQAVDSLSAGTQLADVRKFLEVEKTKRADAKDQQAIQQALDAMKKAEDDARRSGSTDSTAIQNAVLQALKNVR